MTVQTIHVPVPAHVHATSLSTLDSPAAATTAPRSTGLPSACSDFGRCDRNACGHVQRAERHCPSLDTMTGPA